MLYAAYFEGFGVQDPEPMERPPPQSKAPRMTDAEYLANVQKWLKVKREREAKR